MPRQGQAAGTMSPVLSRPPRAPRSRPVFPGVGKGTTATGQTTGAPRATGPDEARRTTRGHEARQRGTVPATAKAQGQVPSNNGHWVPQTREARTTHDEPRHRSRSHGKSGPHTRTRYPQPLGSGPRLHAPRTGGWARGTARQVVPPPPPPGALLLPPRRAKSARKGARSGVGDGSPRPHPPHPQPAGSRPRPHAPSTGGRARESAQLRPSNTKPRGPPHRCPSAAPTLRKASSQERAVGLVTGPHVHPPRTHSQWVAGPGGTFQGRAVGRGRGLNPGSPTQRPEAPPPARPCAISTACKASSQERELWGC